MKLPRRRPASPKKTAVGGSPEATRAALLQAATAVFVASGYEQARVRDIAERAGANVAAINYHFGSKEALYLEVLRRQASERIERYPLPDPAQSATPEAALQAALTMLLSRLLADDQRGFVPKLLMRELLAPSAALPTMVQDVIAPQFRQLSAVVAALLGPRADAATIQRCTFSLVSQCMFYLFARPLVQTLAPQTYDDGAVARLSAHITQFSAAALRAQRERLEHADV